MRWFQLCYWGRCLCLNLYIYKQYSEGLLSVAFPCHYAYLLAGSQCREFSFVSKHQASGQVQDKTFILYHCSLHSNHSLHSHLSSLRQSISRFVSFFTSHYLEFRMDLCKVGGQDWKNGAAAASTAGDRGIIYFGASKKRQSSQAQFFKKEAQQIANSDSVEKVLTTIRSKVQRQFVVDS